MAERAFQSAAADFRASFDGLLAETDGATLEDIDERGAELLAHSQDMEAAAGRNLVAGESDVRELAALQLAAGAAIDVAAATDLLRREGLIETDAALSEGSEVDAAYADLSDILEADPVLGTRQGLPPPPEGAVLLDDPGGPLKAAADKAIDDIAGTAAGIAGHAVDGLRALSLDAIIGAFGQAADRLIGPIVDKVRGFVKLAVRALSKAVSKLLRILGPLEGPARKWLGEKLAGITQDKVVEFVVEHVLDVAEVRLAVSERIGKIPPSTEPDRLEATAGELHSLAARFGRHGKVIAVLAKILEKLRGAILALASWAAAAMAGVYALVLVYGVWVGGDFLDWGRTREDGALDMVAGVRSVIDGLATSQPA